MSKLTLIVENVFCTLKKKQMRKPQGIYIYIYKNYYSYLCHILLYSFGETHYIS